MSGLERKHDALGHRPRGGGTPAVPWSLPEGYARLTFLSFRVLVRMLHLHQMESKDYEVTSSGSFYDSTVREIADGMVSHVKVYGGPVLFIGVWKHVPVVMRRCRGLAMALRMAWGGSTRHGRPRNARVLMGYTSDVNANVLRCHFTMTADSWQLARSAEDI